MKHIKKLLAFAIVAVMMLSLCGLGSYAQTDGTAAEGKGSITISNAANGETYSVYKLFDATVSADGTSIAYTGTIPPSLSAYFVYVNGTDGSNGINATTAAYTVNEQTGVRELTEAARDALTEWAESQTATRSVESDGSVLTFEGLDYGYYVVTTTQGDQVISVDSTMPDVTIIDKNTSPPIVNPTKSADDDDVFIGQTVTYTISFGTANFDGAKKIVKYTIADDFAQGVLTDVTVTSVKVDGVDIGTTTGDVYSPQFDNEGKIEIAWVDGNGKSLYANGAVLAITYTATVAASADIDGEGNTNSVTLSYTTDEEVPWEDPVTETIFTYAIAIQKVDQAGDPLAGAKFKFPFYVQATADATDGAYIYAGTTAADGLVNELTTPEDGLIIVKGVATGEYNISETEAPKGYNKVSDFSVTAVKTGETTTSYTTYYDAEGNEVGKDDPKMDHTVIVSIEDLAATPVVVVNKSGAELPSTGGIGTTIFYVVGGILLVGGAIMLVTKKRVSQKF